MSRRDAIAIVTMTHWSAANQKPATDHVVCHVTFCAHTPLDNGQPPLITTDDATVSVSVIFQINVIK